MPRGRMINKQISRSEKVSELPVEGQLLYTWMIPHTDLEGRLPGDVWSIKALVPFVAEITPENLPKLLNKMKDLELIEYYGNKQKYIQIKDFDKYQTLRKDQEAPTNIPAPDKFKSNNGVTMGQQRSNHCVKEKDKVKEKDIPEVSSRFDIFVSEILKTWQELCARHPQLSTTRKLTAKRKDHLKARFADKDFMDNWRNAMLRVPAVPFLMGKNDRQWVMSFDFFIRNDENYNKILEGAYEKKDTRSRALRDYEEGEK